MRSLLNHCSSARVRWENSHVGSFRQNPRRSVEKDCRCHPQCCLVSSTGWRQWVSPSALLSQIKHISMGGVGAIFPTYYCFTSGCFSAYLVIMGKVFIAVRLFSPLLIFMLAACGPVHERKEFNAQEKLVLHSLALQVSSAEELTVVNEVMDRTHTAAVFFGIVGAAAVAIHDDAEDSKRANALQARLGSIETKALFTETLVDVLRAGNIRTDSVAGAADARLEVDILYWGIRRHSKGSPSLVPFVATSVQMVGSNDNILWEKRDVHVGKYKATHAQYMQQPEKLKAALEDTLREAAEYLANQIIYR